MTGETLAPLRVSFSRLSTVLPEVVERTIPTQPDAVLVRLAGRAGQVIVTDVAVRLVDPVPVGHAPVIVAVLLLGNLGEEALPQQRQVAMPGHKGAATVTEVENAKLAAHLVVVVIVEDCRSAGELVNAIHQVVHVRLDHLDLVNGVHEGRIILHNNVVATLLEVTQVEDSLELLLLLAAQGHDIAPSAHAFFLAVRTLPIEVALLTRGSPEVGLTLAGVVEEARGKGDSVIDEEDLRDVLDAGRDLDTATASRSAADLEVGGVSGTAHSVDAGSRSIGDAGGGDEALSAAHKGAHKNDKEGQ